MSAADLRATAKRLLPAPARRAIDWARALAAPPPVDDVILASYRFNADPDPTPRLTLIIPDLTSRTAFGGVMTGIDLFLELAVQLQRLRQVDLRLILAEPTQETDPRLLQDRAAALGLSCAIERLTGPHSTLDVRGGDVFVAYNWWTARNLQAPAAAQATHFGIAARPLIYLMQEYEPGLYAYSSAHMLAREAYDRPERLWTIVNSAALHAWFEHCGHHAERSFVFEPALNEKLRTYLPRVADSQRMKRILVYGRPTVERNCWPALIRGLREFVATCPAAAEWEIVSAGIAHAPVALGGGRRLCSLGKLSLDDYGELLLTSSVGVSLMASPHPSYPPLEMAHFGLSVVSNLYWGKDLSTFHPNIVSTPSIDAAPLAAAIVAACARTRAPAVPGNPVYLRKEPYGFMNELAVAVDAELGEVSRAG